VLLRMIADLDPNEGEALLDGQSRTDIAPSQWRRRVIYAAAEPGWWHDGIGPHFADLPKASAQRLGLPSDIFDRPVRLCSTGERQRLALLRALAVQPAVLLLDEPTSALDAASIAQVEALLRDVLRGGTAMLLVTHDPAQARRMGSAGLRHMQAGRFVPA
jgi:ABC-type iron transport system FetAB ATPase subunit